MKRLIVASAVVLTLSACGAADRSYANLTGKASEVCHDGVLYLQFTSGTSVKYTKDGKVATC